MQQAVINSAREVCGSSRVGRKNSKSEWWSVEFKVAVGMKDAARKNVLEKRVRSGKKFYKEE